MQPTLAVDSAQRVDPTRALPPEDLSIAPIGPHKRTLDHRPHHRAIVLPRLDTLPHLARDDPSLRNQLGLQE